MKKEIIELITKKPSSFKEIRDALGIRDYNQSKNLNSLLSTLVKEQKIYYRYKEEKYYLKDSNFYLGEFIETRHAYSFIKVENNETKEEISYFNPKRFSLNALDGDIVRFKLISSTNSKGEESQIAKVLRIVKRNGRSTLGEVFFDNKLNFWTLKTVEQFQKHTYKIINPKGLDEGNFVSVKFDDYIEGIIYVKVEEKIAKKFNALIDHRYVMKRYSKEIEFPNDVKELDIEKITNNLKERTNRIDLSNELTYTIDGIKSKDLDDAVSIKEKENSFILMVHIADVSYFVPKGSILDLEAKKRSNSIYLIDFVNPMLPRILSNDLCSLNPNVQKKTMTVEMEISKVDGKLLNYKIFPSTIVSNHRLVYEEVDKFLKGDTSIFEDKNLQDSLYMIKKLAKILRAKKINSGMIDFELPETIIKIDENKEPISITSKYQTESEKIIEDLMVVTNETVALFLEKNKAYSIFRIHEQPDQEKLDALKLFSKTVYSEDNFKDPKDYQKILEFINNNENITSKDLANYIKVIDTLENHIFLKVNLIQTMEKARYEVQNKGHYALGLNHYLHFTSPIRRYPDLVVHRIINQILENKNNFKQSEEEIEELRTISMKASEIEKETMQIERSLMDIKKARFLKKLKEKQSIFAGRIVNILSFGFFVDIDNTFQGLVRYGDDFEASENKLEITNKKTNKKYRLYDKVTVSIQDIVVSQGMIDMKVIEDEVDIKQ